MKRFHIHISVDNLQKHITYYSAIFQKEPSVVHEDYAKWMLDDMRINFAISSRNGRIGLDHLGIQVESEAELEDMQHILNTAELPLIEQKQAACCYAESDKYWSIDPQGIRWEVFFSRKAIPVFGIDSDLPTEKNSSCCGPSSNCC